MATSSAYTGLRVGKTQKGECSPESALLESFADPKLMQLALETPHTDFLFGVFGKAVLWACGQEIRSGDKVAVPLKSAIRSGEAHNNHVGQLLTRI